MYAIVHFHSCNVYNINIWQGKIKGRAKDKKIAKRSKIKIWSKDVPKMYVIVNGLATAVTQMYSKKIMYKKMYQKICTKRFKRCTKKCTIKDVLAAKSTKMQKPSEKYKNVKMQNVQNRKTFMYRPKVLYDGDYLFSMYARMEGSKRKAAGRCTKAKRCTSWIGR